MNYKNLLKDRSGVSPVIGMILILSIVIVSVGIIYTIGIPVLDTAKFNTHMENTIKSFSIIHNDIEEVVRGPITGVGTARISRIDMAGGSLVVKPNNTEMNISYGDGSDLTTINMVPGTISYDYKGQSVIYENGAVFTKYTSGSSMNIEPLIYTTDIGTTSNSIGLMIHVINITSTESSTGGQGVGKVKISVDENGISSLYNDDIKNASITIHSSNYDAWGRYFNDTVSNSGLDITNSSQYTIEIDPDAETVEISIYGANGADVSDISLSLYETKILSTAE